MGKKYVIDETTLTDIANGLRETLNDLDAKHKPEDVRQKINDVYFKAKIEGYDEGEIDGFGDGYIFGKEDGYTEGYEMGKQKGKNDFWRGFTQDGARKSYNSAFMYTDFSGETIPEGLCRPQYENASFRAMDRMFNNYQGRELPKGIDASLIMDGEDVGSLIFNASKLTEIADIGIPSSLAMTGWYQYCYRLTKIEKIRVNENTTYTSTFRDDNKLENVTFEGVIGHDISFAQSPLTVESMISIITHLKNYSADATNKGKHTLTLKDSCKTLMAEQGVIAELGGKTYDQYITDIGWNLA